MAHTFAKVVSVIFHPLMMPVYSLLLLFNVNMYFTSALTPLAKGLLLIMMFSATVFMPVVLFSVLRWKNIISSFQMESNEERSYPYLITAIIYFLMYMLLSQTAIPGVYSVFLICATVLSLLLLLINFKFKISAHMAGIGGVTGLLTGIGIRMNLDLTFLIIMAVAIAGMIGFARLQQNAHRPSEIYLGFLTGVAVFLILILLL